MGEPLSAELRALAEPSFSYMGYVQIEDQRKEAWNALASRAETLERELAEARAEVERLTERERVRNAIEELRDDTWEQALGEPRGWQDATFAAVDRAKREQRRADRLRDALEAIRTLHADEWDGSIPPGGVICKACGVPVESEPCATFRAVTGVLGE